MRLETLLEGPRSFMTNRGEDIAAYTGMAWNHEYTLVRGMPRPYPKPNFLPAGGIGPSGSANVREPFNTKLDGGLSLDFDKSTPNTTILKEKIGPLTNTYLHHNRGPGRVEETTYFDKISYMDNKFKK